MEENLYFSVFCGFRGPEAFQGVRGGHGYILTKFQPKRTHQTQVHTKFDDFGVTTSYICAKDTQAVLEAYASV